MIVKLFSFFSNFHVHWYLNSPIHSASTMQSAVLYFEMGDGDTT